MVDPFEQFKFEMQPLPDLHARNPFLDALKPLGEFARRLRKKPPKEVRENLKAVSADQEAETVRRAKKVNKQIEEWRKSHEAK